jgi:hypothetical protein
MQDSSQTIEYSSFEEKSPLTKNKNSQIIIIVVVILLILCCCCTVMGLVLAWFYGDAVLEMLGLQVTSITSLL